ncbi:MAG: hypothetical protein HOG49_00995 [Candidatus Scalindua sp.]|jgi:dUTP pyrophosphatase|nr:hypothetical protein [Candidatus Scalindua sp.]
MKIKIKCLNGDMRELWGKKQHKGDCGLDIPMSQCTYQVVNGMVTLDLGIACEPDNAFMIIPRSSISKTPFRLANNIGIIDKDYRGELMAVCDYRGNVAFHDINRGDRLFQMVAFDGQPIEWELVHELNETKRGSSGFGSTGGVNGV